MKIRVLEVLATLKRAGAERMAVSLAAGLDRRRFETGVATLFDEFPNGLEPELQEAGVPVWHLGKRPGLDLRMVPRLRRVMRGFQPDVIHTHSYVLRYSLPAGLGLPKKALVHTVHNLAEKETDRTGRILHRLAFGRRVAAVAVGEEVRRSYCLHYGAEPAATIRNGIEIAAYRRPGAREQWRSAHGFNADNLLIVSAGRLEPQKNPQGLIEAFLSAFADNPRTHLLLAGDGSLRQALESAAPPRVHFLGVRSDIPALLAAGDLFALASDWEGTPLAVMEAMAAGLPVVATAVGGIPELVADGETGVLVRAGDTGALAEALARVAEDNALRKNMGSAARMRAETFDASVMIEQYAALFERLAGGAR